MKSVYEGKGKGKFRQSLHPAQQMHPAEATGYHMKSSCVGNNQRRPVAAAASMCDLCTCVISLQTELMVYTRHDV